MAVAGIETSEGLIIWRYLWWALTAIAVMIAAIMAANLWLLNFIHVFSSLLWTGVDLFMGFVLGPILRRVDLSVRREIGPSTNPMKRSTPVHNRLENTWMKFSSQRLAAMMAAIITAMAVNAHQR